ncbi:MAG TPA: hypothetical protein VGU66_18090 [Candidatus Elarobacter sp.]|nr:hypothetical protein [Candidatus Elarobacter sp.]
MRVEELVDEGGVLIHEQGIAMLLRLVLLHATDGPPGDDNFVETLVKLMLVVNELFGSHQGLIKPDISDEDLVDIELRGAIIPAGDTTSLLARPFTFLRWADEADGKSVDNWIDVRGDFVRLLHMTVDEYIVGTAFFVLYLVNATRRFSKRTSSVIRISDLERSLADPQPLRRWIAQFISPLSAVRDELVACEHDYSSASLVPFLRHPLISIDGDRVVCPLPATLDNLLAAGFYFALFDAYKSHGEESNSKRFSAMYGRFFEDYVDTLLERIVDPEVSTMSRERSYASGKGESRTSDFLVLDEARRLVVVEAAKTRLNFKTTLIDRNRESLTGDIRRIIVANGRQISRTIRDLRAGRFGFPCRHEELNGVYAIIVAGQRLPGLYGVNAIAEDALRNDGGLPECRGLHVIDIDELEILAAEHYHALPLGEILEAKSQHADRFARTCRLQTFIDHYTDIKPAPKRIVPSAYDAFFDDVMMPMLKEWGLRE